MEKKFPLSNKKYIEKYFENFRGLLNEKQF